MRVFITGVTGYIGHAAAVAFISEGYEVAGLTRDPEKADLLSRQGIEPVVGSMQDPSSYRKAAASVDLLIHAAVDYTEETAGLDAKTMETLLVAAHKRGQAKVLYTSGVWVYGNCGDASLKENTERKPAAAVLWRPAIEEKVLSAGGFVIRPGVVYGHDGGMTAAWFKAAVQGGEIPIVGNGENRWAMVHIDDLARGYILVVERGQPGTAYNFVDDGEATVGQMVTAVISRSTAPVTVSYLPQAEAAQSMGAMAEAYALDQHLATTETRQALGWNPRYSSFLQELRQTAEV
jgi:nucleoside-diphosphate-sugar epimerase